jgi:hypothetical protein
MVIDTVSAQPLTSETMKLYVPGCPAVGPGPCCRAVFHLIAVTVTVELPPLQRMGVAVAVANSCGGDVTVTVVCAVQPLSSVTVKVCVPVVLPNVPVPLYGGVPPEAVTVIVDISPPQVMGVAVEDAVSRGGSVMVIVVFAVQPLASVTVNVYVPAGRRKAPIPVYGASRPKLSRSQSHHHRST